MCNKLYKFNFNLVWGVKRKVLCNMADQVSKKIGRRVRILRTASEKTIEELALALGWNRMKLHRIETAQKNVNIGELLVICDYFGYKLDDFIGDTFEIRS